MGNPSRLMFHVKQHPAGTVGLLNRRIGAEVGSACVRAEVLDGRGSHANERPHRSPIYFFLTTAAQVGPDDLEQNGELSATRDCCPSLQRVKLRHEFAGASWGDHCRLTLLEHRPAAP
jgi:hypothetical protein